MRFGIMMGVAFLLLGGCKTVDMDMEPPGYYWTTDRSVEDVTACLVPALDGTNNGYLHEAEDLFPGRYAEVRPLNARLMGGVDLYYVGVNQTERGSSLFLFGYGGREVADQLRPVIVECV